MAAIPRTKKEQEEYDKKIASSQAADAARKVAIAKRNAEDKEILKDYKGPQVGGAAAGNKAEFVKKSRQKTAAEETAKRFAETSFEAPTNKELKLKLGMQSKENQAALNQPMSEELTNVMADIARARAETGLGRESEDSPAAPAAPAITDGADAYSVAQKDFNEKFGGSMGRAMEGETGDQYEARLKQRNVDRKAALGELAKLKPQDAAPAVADAAAPENTVLKPMGEITGTSFGDTSLDLTPREFMAPPASPQASSSARATASNAPTVITDPKERLKGRQEFGSYLENQLNRSGGSYTFNKGDQSRAKALGIGRKEMDNFMNRLGRRDDNQFGARGCLRRRNT